MKALCVIILLLAQVAGAQATLGLQDNEPEVEILKYSWNEYNLILQQELDPQMSTAADPRPRSIFAEPRHQEPMPRSHPSSDTQTKGYQYKVRIKNSSTKTIKSIDWDYVFVDPSNPKEISHHRFHTDKKIDPGKDEQITVSSTIPPIQVINVKAIDKPNKPTEKIVVMKIEYTDGTTWERP